MTFPVQGAWTRQSVSINGSEPFELQRVYWLQTTSVYADLRVPFHPAGGTACFAGRSGWDGDRYVWSHPLDLIGPGAASPGHASPGHASPDDASPGSDGPNFDGPNPLVPGSDGPNALGPNALGPNALGRDAFRDDIGELIWNGDRLIERGTLPGGIAYEEIWVRLPGDPRDSEAVEAPTACHVRVGNYAITIVDTRPDGGSFNACYRVRTTHGWEISAAIGDLDVGAMDLRCAHTANPSHPTQLQPR
ncbi:MAG: hypothetical protein QOJ52_1535 [Acidimicrobiaceae bacterium]|nr:hypothetical protein [Acidimicrobiaceae bacterium]